MYFMCVCHVYINLCYCVRGVCRDTVKTDASPTATHSRKHEVTTRKAAQNEFVGVGRFYYNNPYARIKAQEGGEKGKKRSEDKNRSNQRIRHTQPRPATY